MQQTKTSKDFLSDLLDTAPVLMGNLVKKGGHVMMQDSSVSELSEILDRDFSEILVLSMPLQICKHKTEEKIKMFDEDVQRSIALYSSKKLGLNNGLPLPVAVIGSAIMDGKERSYGIFLPEELTPSSHNWPYLYAFTNMSYFFSSTPNIAPIFGKNYMMPIFSKKVSSCALYAGVTDKIFRNAEMAGDCEMAINLNFPLPFYFRYERALCYAYCSMVNGQEKACSDNDGDKAGFPGDYPVLLKLIDPVAGILARSNVGIRRFMVPAYTRMHVKYSVLDKSRQAIYPVISGF